MRDIVRWLRTVEQLAYELYRSASEYYSNDLEFSRFLVDMAEEELTHVQLMESAMQWVLEVGKYPSSVIRIDDEISHRIERPLRGCLEQLKASRVSRSDFLSCVVHTEFSELNDLFLYVMRTCQKHHKSFQRIASSIQAHKENIKAFLERIPGGEKPLSAIKTLPDIWDKKYLVVDDEPATVELLSLLLQNQAEVLTAADGREALDLIANNYFNVIISDINMPVMTGIELFERAKELEEGLSQRFILTTGHATPEVSLFCVERGIHLLLKPYSLFELKKVIAEVGG